MAGERHPELRASDADRDRVAELLRDHYGAGRLDDAELDARLDVVHRARHLGELERLTADLPGPPGSALAKTPRRHVTRGGRALRASVKMHATIFVLVNLMLIGIWAASGGGYFWPIWSLLGWGVGLGAHAAPILAGAGTRPYDPARKQLQRAAAPDGTVTILFTDIEGSTALNDQLGDVRWMELLRAHHTLVREQVSLHGGFEVKEQGDGFMVAFPSARRAIDCARAIQQAVAARLEAQGLRVRIGLNTGEAIREEDDFYGRNVVLAARIAARAQGGQTLTSAVVKELTESAGDVTFTDQGEVTLDGLSGVHRLYAVS